MSKLTLEGAIALYDHASWCLDKMIYPANILVAKAMQDKCRAAFPNHKFG